MRSGLSQIGPMQHQPRGEADVGLVAVEGPQRLNAGLAVELVVRLRDFRGVPRPLRLLRGGVKHRRVGEDHFHAPEVVHILNDRGMLPDFGRAHSTPRHR